MTRARAVAVVALAVLVAPGVVEAAPTVAVAKGEGPKKAAVAQVASALKKALAADGLDIVDAKPAGKKGKVDVKLARAVGAAFLVVIDAQEAKKKFRVDVEVLRVSDGRSIHRESSEPYAGKADAAKVGRGLATGVVVAINDAAAPAVSPPPPVEAPKEPVCAAATPKDEAPTPVDPPAAERARPTPKDEPGPAHASAAAPMFEVGVGSGSQLSSAYTVLVGGAPTALAYTLSPLLLIDAGVRFQIPNTAFGVEATFAFSPVKFGLDTNPPVSPAEPGGSFLEVGGTIGWRYRFSDDPGGREGFAIEPLAGVRFESLSVEAQSRPIVLGASAVVPHFGVRALYGVTDALGFHADVRVRLPLGYSETGATTGDDGSGFGLVLSGGGRYWFTQHLGASLAVSYAYTSMSFSGNGTRQLLSVDGQGPPPALVDASVASSNLRLAAGVLLAF